MSKNEQYTQILPQAQSLVSGETDLIANMANLSALLHRAFGFWWTGFYRMCGEELILGPFQGPLACTRIPFGKGVCGIAWQREETIVVPDVEKFPGHIACSSESRSEIVVPVWKDGKFIAVLDIDSEKLGAFDDVETANEYPSSICSMGFVFVRDGKAVDNFYTLVHPEPDYQFLDTLKSSRRYFGRMLPNHQLQTSAAACGFDLRQHHNALADAEACAAIAAKTMSLADLW